MPVTLAAIVATALLPVSVKAPVPCSRSLSELMMPPASVTPAALISTVAAVAVMLFAMVSKPPAVSVASFPPVVIPLVVVALAVTEPTIRASVSLYVRVPVTLAASVLTALLPASVNAPVPCNAQFVARDDAARLGDSRGIDIDGFAGGSDVVGNGQQSASGQRDIIPSRGDADRRYRADDQGVDVFVGQCAGHTRGNRVDRIVPAERECARTLQPQLVAGDDPAGLRYSRRIEIDGGSRGRNIVGDRQ